MSKNKGFVSIILFFLIVAIALAVMPVIMQNLTYHAVNQSDRAFFIADSGIGFYIKSQLVGDSDWSNNAGLAKNFGGGSFTISIVGPNPREAGRIILRSTGTITVGTGTFNRIVEQTITRQSPFQYAAFADGNLILGMSGQARTDSYNSSIGRYNVGGNIGQNGDVGTNGDISMSGQAHIGGDASTGPAGVFNDQSRVSGTISHSNNTTLPLITVPAALSGRAADPAINLSGQSTQTITGDHKYPSITLSGQTTLTVVGPANIYLTASSALAISGQAKLDVSSSSTGPVVMYVDNNVSASGQGLMNSTYIPSNFQLYGTGTNQTFTLSGQGEMYGAVYAPNANITLSGQGALYGSFIGDRLTMSGQGGIHYDEALINISLPGSGSSGNVLSRDWKEI